MYAPANCRAQLGHLVLLVVECLDPHTCPCPRISVKDSWAGQLHIQSCNLTTARIRFTKYSKSIWSYPAESLLSKDADVVKTFGVFQVRTNAGLCPLAHDEEFLRELQQGFASEANIRVQGIHLLEH